MKQKVLKAITILAAVVLTVLAVCTFASATGTEIDKYSIYLPHKPTVGATGFNVCNNALGACTPAGYASSPSAEGGDILLYEVNNDFDLDNYEVFKKENPLVSDISIDEYLSRGSVQVKEFYVCGRYLYNFPLIENGKCYVFVLKLSAKSGYTFSDNFYFDYHSANGDTSTLPEILTYKTSNSAQRVAVIVFDYRPKIDIKAEDIKLSSTSFTYNGKAQKPTVTIGTLVQDKDFTVSYSADTVNTGTKTVTITGKGRYTGTFEQTYTIKQKAITANDAKLSATSFTYNGKAQKPTVTIGKLVSGKDYTVVYSKDLTNAGTKTVTVNCKGNYKGTFNKSFAIVQATAKITAKGYTGAYDAKAHTITLSGVPAGSTVKYRTSAKAAWSATKPSVKKLGKTTIYYSVENKNYKTVTGSVVITLNSVKPGTTSIKKLTPASKGFKVTWKKQTSKVTGYQIQYSTSKNFTSAKTVTIKKNSTTSASISKLKTGTKYYVRIRTYYTIGSETFNSAWSSASAVTVK